MKVFRVLLAAAIVGGAVLVAGLLTAGSAESKQVAKNNILARAMDIQTGRVTPNGKEPATRLSGGVVNAALEQAGLTAKGTNGVGRLNGGGGGGAPPTGSIGCANTFHGSPKNVRVNQDCSLRRQAEEWLGVNPRDFNNVLAGQNDSVIGFNHCGYDWSVTKGRVWGSVGTQPATFWQYILPDGHTADACSDPAGTFDHLGNAYTTGVLFDINSAASAIPVVKSNWPNRGLFYHTTVPTDAFQEYRTAPLTGPAADNDPNVFHDKELMIADTRPGSSKRGRIYVTWTRFQDNTGFGENANSPIVFSQSTDGGATWSPAVIISGSSSAFCTDFSGSQDPNACDQDQGSDPVVGPDGTIYVIFGNGNTPAPGINQVLMVKCPATSSCNSASDWLGPFRIGTLDGTHPTGRPGNPQGCPTGRQCLPPNGYRAPEFTSLTISVDRNSNLHATWADHRNSDANCRGSLPPATSPCDMDIFFSFSTNGGVTWSPELSITPRSRLGNNAQWQPWSDVKGDGSKLYVAFYDRHYGNCESTGCNDITLATISNPRSNGRQISYRRITTGSMPNLIPATNPVQAGFLGDYMWLEVSRHNFDQRDVHMVWADTRPLPYRYAHQRAPEEDIYYARVHDEGHGGGDDDD